MYKDLKFVQGAVAKKDLIPGMTHFAIEKGTIRAYNGMLALCSGIALDIECKPKADQLVDAIGNCSSDHTIVITLTDKGRMRIQNGPFKVLVDCIEEPTPHVNPEGKEVYFQGSELRSAFNAILPFVGSDASRPWTNGILLSGASAFATNNVIVVEYWMGVNLPFTINLPREAVREVLRIGEDPTHVQLSENSITFHYADGKWIRSGLYEASSWPDLRPILDVSATALPLNPKFFSGIQAIEPFVDKIGNIYFENGTLTTHLDVEMGASYALDSFPFTGAYAVGMLQLLNGIVDEIDWSCYPKPCPFFGKMMRGAIIGRHR